jgi:hypothetical protein
MGKSSNSNIKIVLERYYYLHINIALKKYLRLFISFVLVTIASRNTRRMEWNVRLHSTVIRHLPRILLGTIYTNMHTSTHFMLITVATPSNAWPVFAQSIFAIVCSNTTRGMDFFVLCLLTYLLTYVRSWALPEKLQILHPFRTFPAILRNPKVHHRLHKSPILFYLIIY